MAIISANLQFNRGGHELLDYSSFQTNYSTALAWAKDPNSNAAVGQFIYLESEEEIEEQVYAKGPYVVEAIGSGAVITPLSKSVAGEEDLAGTVSDLKVEVSEIKTNLAKTDASVQVLESKIGSIPETFVTDVQDSSGNSLVSGGVAKLGNYATKEELDSAIGGIDFSSFATKEGVDASIQAAIESIPDPSVKNVSAEDKILKLTEGVLSSELSFTMDSSNDGKKYINLKGKDDVLIGAVDTTDFVVDGMLEKVEFDPDTSTKLVFTFNTAAGKEPISVDFAKYVDIYRADGSTLELESSTNTFKVKDGVFATIGLVNEVSTALSQYKTSNNKAVASKVSQSAYDIKVGEIDSSIESIKTDLTTNYLRKDSSYITKLEGLANIKTVGENLNVSEDGQLTVDLSSYATTQSVSEGYVAKEEGKGLSTEDFTTELKTKLEGIEASANVNVIESISIDGSALTPDGSKSVNIDIASKISNKLDSTATVNGVSFVENALTIDAANIQLDEAIMSDDSETYPVSSTLQVVLQSLNDRITSAVSGGLTSVTAGNGISVSGISGNSQTISVKVSDASNNALTTDASGAFVPDMRSYWETI